MVRGRGPSPKTEVKQLTSQSPHRSTLAVAAATARSLRALKFLCPGRTFGTAELADAMAACEARLAVIAVWIPVRFDCRLGTALLGELLVDSGCLTAIPFLKLVAGGWGSGLAGPLAVTELTRLIGECVAELVGPFRALLILTPVINSCSRASSGLRRRAGSHRRHLVIKSRNASSSHFNTCRSSFELGLRRLPFDETVNRGLPIESKKSFLRLLVSIRCFSGGPKTSMMQASCSCSFSPGKIGYPVYNSASMHPKLHMSIGMPYDMPRMTSGDR